MRPCDHETYIVNEFAAVKIRRDDSANGPRLRVEALRTGAVIHLDALELERIAGARHEDLAPIVRPTTRDE